MTTLTFNVPDWVDPLGASERTWALIISILAAALVASILVEIFKRKYNAAQWKKAQDEITPLAKHYVALLLTALASLFTAASYFIVFAQTNASTLSVVPFLGDHVPQAIGAAYLLYNLRLNKTYKNVAGFLGKWSKEKPATTGVADPQSAAAPAPVEPPSDSLLS
jgi:hypothetical protein